MDPEKDGIRPAPSIPSLGDLCVPLCPEEYDISEETAEELDI